MEYVTHNIHGSDLIVLTETAPPSKVSPIPSINHIQKSYLRNWEC